MECKMKFFDLFLKVEYFVLASISNNELRNLLSIRINVSNILILLRIFNTITSMVIITTLLERRRRQKERKKAPLFFQCLEYTSNCIKDSTVFSQILSISDRRVGQELSRTRVKISGGPIGRCSVADSKDKFRSGVCFHKPVRRKSSPRVCTRIVYIHIDTHTQCGRDKRRQKTRERERKRSASWRATSSSSFTIARREAREKRWEPRRTVVAEAFSDQSRLSLRVRRIPDDERT